MAKHELNHELINALRKDRDLSLPLLAAESCRVENADHEFSVANAYLYLGNKRENNLATEKFMRGLAAVLLGDSQKWQELIRGTEVIKIVIHCEDITSTSTPEQLRDYLEKNGIQLRDMDAIKKVDEITNGQNVILSIRPGSIEVRMIVTTEHANKIKTAFEKGDEFGQEVLDISIEPQTVEKIAGPQPRRWLVYLLIAVVVATLLVLLIYWAVHNLGDRRDAQNFQRTGLPVVAADSQTIFDVENGVWKGWARFDTQIENQPVAIQAGTRGILVQCKGVSPPKPGYSAWGQSIGTKVTDLTNCSFDVIVKPEIGTQKSEGYDGAEVVCIGVLDASESGWQLSISMDRGNDTNPKLKISTCRFVIGEEKNSVLSDGASLLTDWQRGSEIMLSIERKAGGIEFYASIAGDRKMVASFESDQAMGPVEKVFMRAGGYREADFGVEFLSAFVYRLKAD